MNTSRNLFNDKTTCMQYRHKASICSSSLISEKPGKQTHAFVKLCMVMLHARSMVTTCALPESSMMYAAVQGCSHHQGLQACNKT